MVQFFKILWKYAPPYKLFVFLNVIFNFVQTIFSLFSLA
ncbi:MAG: hypothetical protein RIS47_2326, partial [Bacteroidota bacterium]